MRFSDIIGLEDIKRSLSSSIDNKHIAHAQLFYGKEGSANLGMALSYATYLNCENPNNHDACGICSSCQKMEKHIHPDVQFIFPVSSTKKIASKDAVSQKFIAEWRDFLIDSPYRNANDWSTAFGGENKNLNISKEESRNIIKNVSLKAFEGQYKIVIIWLPEFMHPSTANGILKVLEEPPEKTVFLLVSCNVERLLTTIRSRTQMVKVRSFEPEELKGYLINQHKLDENKAIKIAHMADGNLNEADKLVDHLEEDSHEMFREWMRQCYKRDYKNLVASSDKFHQLNKVAQRNLIQYGLNMMRETFITFYKSTNDHMMTEEASSFISNFSKVMNPEKIENVTTYFNDAHYQLERNANPKILFLDLSLMISNTIKS